MALNLAGLPNLAEVKAQVDRIEAKLDAVLALLDRGSDGRST